MRYEYLTAVRGIANPRRAMNADTDVVILDQHCFARVQTHSCAQRPIARPRVIVQRTLCIERGVERVVRVCKGKEHGVARTAEPVATMVSTGVVQERTVLLQQLAILLRTDFGQALR